MRIPFRFLPSIVVGLHSVSQAQEAEPDYNREVRPILSDKCFGCHGPDQRNNKAGLRLDTRESAILPNKHGQAALVPGRPAESGMLQRVLSTDPDEVMPPPESKKHRLTDAQADILKRWIASGADYQPHWAFRRVERPALPAGARGNAVDVFISDALAGQKLTLSPEAPRRVLIRRLWLDVTGLLPAPERVEALVNDPRPDAWERLVDEALASPHYGERWGRHWMDQARYADSNGYAIDSPREMWPWRDWVIAALNRDMPFDQFTVEQLAGDMLPQATRQQRMASAFHRNTLINEEGGTDKEQFRVEQAMDRVNTTGAVWLGLTVGCAQCHDHKYDPVSMKDYYSLLAFFNQGTDVNDRGATLDVAADEIFPRPAKPQTGEKKQSAAPASLEEWEKNLAAGTGRPAWQTLQPETYVTDSNASFTLTPEKSLLTDGKATGNDTYRITMHPKQEEIAALRLEVLTHPSLPNQGPGTAGNGNFVLTEFEVFIEGEPVPLQRAFASVEQDGYPVSHALDGKPASGWAVNAGSRRLNQAHAAEFVFKSPLKPGGRELTVVMKHGRNTDYLVGHFALKAAATAPVSAPVEPEDEQKLLAAVRTPAAQRTPQQKTLVQRTWQAASGGKPAASGKDVVELMVMQDLPPEKARPTYILARGDFLNPDKKSGPLKPAPISSLPGWNAPAEPRRLDLAKWLVSRENPLTARVTVNRIWMRYFGQGIVNTDNDFGLQGSLPTHPELLDWLAAEFMENGWSMKKLHRQILTSATYRQSSSHGNAAATAADPLNRLLWRQNRLRVEGEIVRDAALTASGLLTPSLGGPPFFPPQPDGVYAFTQRSKEWKTSTGTDRFRRSLYIAFYRSAPYPLLSTFDCPDFQSVTTQRPRSNTPLQALTSANDAMLFEIAQGFARRLLREIPGDSSVADAQRIARAFELALSRPPTEAEQRIAQEFLTKQQAAFAADAAAVKAAAPFATGPDAPAQAAWIATARLLLNTDEFITRE